MSTLFHTCWQEAPIQAQLWVISEPWCKDHVEVTSTWFIVCQTVLYLNLQHNCNLHLFQRSTQFYQKTIVLSLLALQPFQKLFTLIRSIAMLQQWKNNRRFNWLASQIFTQVTVMIASSNNSNCSTKLRQSLPKRTTYTFLKLWRRTYSLQMDLDFQFIKARQAHLDDWVHRTRQ